MASYAKQSFHKVDIRNAINILKELMDLPCHLMYKDTGQNCKATWVIDSETKQIIKRRAKLHHASIDRCKFFFFFCWCATFLSWRVSSFVINWNISPYISFSLRSQYWNSYLISRASFFFSAKYVIFIVRMNVRSANNYRMIILFAGVTMYLIFLF